MVQNDIGKNMKKDAEKEINTTPTNAELQKLLRQVMSNLTNWKLQVERNPNPRLVHSFKNIASIIESISSIAERKLEFSYKALSGQMAMMIHEVANLNCKITDSLKSDDYIDEDEEKEIVGSLFNVIKAATDLIRIVQEGFGGSNRKRKPLSLPTSVTN